MARILIADDEERIRSIIKEYALHYGYEVSEAKDGSEAVKMAKEQNIDLIVLDVMMPEMDGFSVCREIQKSKKIPIIMLSARGEEYDKILGFELGIDDYVVKPFSPKELMMRVQVVLQRNQKEDENQTVEVTGLKIDFSGRDVFVDHKKVDLTPKEFDLLALMVKNRNKAFTRNILLEQVWGYSTYVDDRTIDTHIKTLRNQLGPYRDYIVTVRGIGYKFQPEIQT